MICTLLVNPLGVYKIFFLFEYTACAKSLEIQESLVPDLKILMYRNADEIEKLKESVLTLSLRAFSSISSWDWPPFRPSASCKNKKISIPLDLLQKVLEVFDYLLPAA